MKKIVFDKNGKFVLGQTNINKFYIDNPDFIIVEVEDYDIKYEYSYINGEVQKQEYVPTDEDVKQIEEQTKKDKYQQPRKIAYPSLAEQFDKLFHDINNNKLNKDGSFYKSIKEVKDNFPKE
tara:strand:+ start:316 stop:681 length:366 start_codon:yes stop_codon:yes gene_type:complete